MPRTKQANQEIREKTKNQILDSASKVFLKKGLAVTIADIASEANISQGLAYRYFSKKEDIFLALLEQSLQSRENLEEIFNTIQGSPILRLHSIILKLSKNRYEKPDFYTFFYDSIKKFELSQEIQEKIRIQGETVYKILTNIIVEGQKNGEIVKDDPTTLLQIILTFLKGFSFQDQLIRKQDYIKMVDIFMRVFTPIEG